jgi:hypothetical protein
MEMNDLVGDGKPETHASGLGGEERTKLGQALLGNAWPVVRDLHPHAEGTVVLRPDHHRSPVAGGFAGVPHQVLESPLEELFVADEREGLGQIEVHASAGPASRLARHDASQHPNQVERLRLESLALDEIDEAPHHRFERLALLPDVAADDLQADRQIGVERVLGPPS